MLTKDNNICVIDIGSWEIKAIAALITNDYKLKNIYFSKVKSIGIENGKVTDIDLFSETVEKVLYQLEEKLGRNISKVNLCIGGDHIKSYDSEGMVTISELGTEIKKSDVEKAMDSAKLLSVPMDRRILHVYRQGFTVDNQPNVSMPVGMYGKKLKARLHIITGLENKIQNIIRGINNLGVQVEEIVFSGFMNINSLLNEREKNQGGVIIDIGATTVKIISIKKGKFLNSKVIQWGGIDLTRRIKQVLKRSFKESEKIKKDIISFYPPDEVKDSISLSESESKVVGIISDFLRERFQTIKKDLKKEIINLTSENFIITGGVALMGGTVELIEDIFGVETKVAKLNFYNLKRKKESSFLNSCLYSSSLGTLNRILIKKEKEYNKPTTKIVRSLAKVRNFFREYF